MCTKESAENKLNIILTKEEMNRVTMSIRDGIFKITINVHKMTRQGAKRIIKNIIAVIREMFILLVIHGYNNGTAIKDMLRTDFLSMRIEKIEGEKYNQGRTKIEVCAA